MLHDLSEATFTRQNMAAVLETIDHRDTKWDPPLLAFFWKIGISHACTEVVQPALNEGKCLIVAGIRQTPWPPWAFGTHRIRALYQAWLINDKEAGLGNTFVLDDDISNIGLQAAVYREVMNQLVERDIQHVSHVVIKGAILAHKILTDYGFEETEDIVLTDHAQYKIYRAKLQEHIKRLGIDGISTVKLLTCDIDENVYNRISLLIATTYFGTKAYWTESSYYPEILPANTELVSSGGQASTHGPPGPDPGC